MLKQIKRRCWRGTGRRCWSRQGDAGEGQEGAGQGSQEPKKPPEPQDTNCNAQAQFHWLRAPGVSEVGEPHEPTRSREEAMCHVEGHELEVGWECQLAAPEGGESLEQLKGPLASGRKITSGLLLQGLGPYKGGPMA